MGSDNFRQVGTFDFTEGIGTSVSGTASSFSCSNQSVSDKGFSKESVVTKRSEHSDSEGCIGGDGGVLSSYSGSTHSLLPRRFSHQESLPISFGGTHQFVYPFTPETGFFDFMGKIRDNSQSEFQFPGRTFSDRFGSSASSRREGSQGTSVSQCSDSVFICPSSSIASAGGFLDFDHGRHSTRTSTYSSNPVVSVGVLAPVPILPRLLPHLQWWLQEKHLRKGVLLDPPDPSLTLFTDASLMGWGAYLEGRTASGLWSGAQLEEHINLLEMRAVFLSLRQFQAVVQGQSLLVATDNSTVVAYLQNQGGTHSFSLRESLGSRCYDPILEGNVQLHVPSFSSSSKDLAQDSEGSLQDHSYCSGLATTVLVPRTTTSVLCEASSSSSKRGSTVSIQRKKTASGSRESPSARLVTVRNSLRKGGFSEGATKRISGSVRQSTGAVYDSKWSIFCTWCLSKQIDPITVTVQQLADFFLHLFEEKGYSPSTIKGYRSAIARTISLSGGSDFGDNEFLSLLIKKLLP
ncbi:unnamed protein product [Mytilus edulis]|uniref:Core-binding (CB) domain-containing protein n=1 Tax=Mytilus edulis TaxID=6550 RepID=A0A8S3UEJ3_MYTED|nr:unnamed protein product [Mytilus edulis]